MLKYKYKVGQRVKLKDTTTGVIKIREQSYIGTKDETNWYFIKIDKVKEYKIVKESEIVEVKDE